jgi:hypothetical protein
MSPDSVFTAYGKIYIQYDVTDAAPVPASAVIAASMKRLDASVNSCRFLHGAQRTVYIHFRKEKRNVHDERLTEIPTGLVRITEARYRTDSGRRCAPL